MTNPDLKKSKSTPTSRSTLQQEKYVADLEQEKAKLLKQLANYEKEQRASVKIYDDQKELIDEKEKQLVSKDEELMEQEEAITKLKARISELAKELNFLKKFDNFSEEIETTELGTQTEGINPAELEEQILEKRVENLKDFGSYREILKVKEKEITQLNDQIILYQQQIRKLISQPNQNRNKLFILTILLIIITSLLFFK